jgi:hypothetical protein
MIKKNLKKAIFKMGAHIYRVWVKTDKENHKQWHTSDLMDLQSFLDTKYPEWCYFNVYDKKSNINLGSFTKYKRANARKI